MRAVIEITNVEADEELRRFIERRLQFALSRFSPRIRRVAVLLAAERRLSGGMDKFCQINVSLDQADDETVEVHGRDIESAITHAFARVSRLLERKLAGTHP
jgi:putative sigma-54 modulation protein